jgi:4-amino-4-deoxy-L-arabinose transferase-like glycosyltransferase
MSGIPIRILWLLLVLLATVGFFHLGADFPNHSRFADDAAKFTDEGWYAAGALNHHLLGHWLRPGDFNPMVTIPVWSVLLAAIFHFTGISLVLARAIAFLFTLGSVLAAGALFQGEEDRPLFMLLLISSPLLYFFSRIALLEPALIFFILASAVSARSSSTPRLVLTGVLFVLAMLTKSSAVFAGPAIAYLLWFPHRAESRKAIRTIAVSLGTIIVFYGIYWLLVVRTHPVDVHVLYAQNIPYLGVKSIEKAVRILYRSFTWIDPILFPIAIAGVIASLTPRFRPLWRDWRFGFAILLYVGYSGFLLLHVDAGPRYFAVLVLPVLMVVLLFRRALAAVSLQLANALTGVIAVAIAVNLFLIARALLHPEYTLRDADLAIGRQIDADPTANHLVVGHGALESTFITHIPALDDIGAKPVAEKFAEDHPGWVVAYSGDLALMTDPAVAAHYRFVEAGKYRVLDTPGRQYLMLFRIVPQ